MQREPEQTLCATYFALQKFALPCKWLYLWWDWTVEGRVVLAHFLKMKRSQCTTVHLLISELQNCAFALRAFYIRVC